jgi:hypothetical protein
MEYIIIFESDLQAGKDEIVWQFELHNSVSIYDVIEHTANIVKELVIDQNQTKLKVMRKLETKRYQNNHEKREPKH